MNAALLRVALWTVIPIGLLIVAARTLTRPRTVEIDDYTRAEMAEMQTQHAEYVRR